MYAYCGNNPVVRRDAGGYIWETVFDIVSLAFSIADVAANPDDPWAWAGLAGDVIDLVPFVCGVGEVIKVAKYADKALEFADAVHDMDKAMDTLDDIHDAKKAAGNIVEKTSKSVHGNSLNCTKTNYGYVLVDADDNIMKFGETINPKRRYTKKYLESNGYTMKVLEQGNKLDVHYWQYDMNMYYKSKYGVFPPLNKRGW